MNISPLSAGDAAIAGAAALLTLYEGWLFVRRRAHIEHLWIAAICAAGGAYALSMAVHYNVGPDLAVVLARIEGACLTTLSVACLGWALTISCRATRGRMIALGIVWIVFVAVAMSPWLVRSTYPVHPPLGDFVLWRRAMTPAVGALQTVGVVFVLRALHLSTLASPVRRADVRYFQLGVGLWGATAAHSVVASMLGHQPTFSTVEYGFAALAGCLVARDVQRYMTALAASEQAAAVATEKHHSLEALHRDVIASVAEGVMLLDAHDRVLLWNPALARMTGLEERAVRGRALWELLELDSDGRRVLASAIAHAREGGTVTTSPVSMGARARSVVCTLTTSARGAIAVLRDVTAEAATREALIRSERNAKALIANLPDAIAVIAEGRVVFANAALRALLGRDDVAALDVGLLDLDRAQQGGPAVEVRLRARGEPITAEVRRVGIEFDGAAADAVLVRDVTEQRALAARMVELDRMVAVGTLAAGVGHEINNPLAYVMVNLEELRGAALGPRERPLLDEALKGAGRIRDIVRAISGFSRVAVERRAIGLQAAVQSAITMAGNEIRHRARLTVEHEGDPYVVSNEAELAQVVLNLLVNASQAVGPGGPGAQEVRVRTFSRDGNAVCEVTDTGGGIPVDVRPRIFDPFFTTKPVGQGTGLGLSICRQTIRALGGDIEVESEPSVGSTFRILLPLAARVSEPARAPRRSSLPPGPRLRVMFVDDEESLARAVARPLRRHFELTLCSSADEALERLARGEEFDVVVTDLMMPGKTGMELHALVERRFPHMAARMLFATGGAFTPDARAFAARHEDRLVAKPIDLAELRRKIRAVATDADPPARLRA